MMEIMVTVDVTAPTPKLVVRWVDRLPAGLYNEMCRALDSLHGIERIYSHRYSVEVFFADHIYNFTTAVNAVKSALKTLCEQNRDYSGIEII